ncbi:hypothetical protein ACQPW1_22210 [Nocardia sp. CA-128927]|uniref:hypothetical protein n=1 Tax=Nocardia sp. CA-128927 TaxID=3239975 RepID=UPI003D95A180
MAFGLAVAGLSLEAPSAPAAPAPAPWPSPSSPLTVDKVWPGVTADPKLLTTVFEESSIVRGGPEAKMSAADVANILPDTNTDIEALNAALLADPEAKKVASEVAAPGILGPFSAEASAQDIAVKASAITNLLKAAGSRVGKVKNAAAVKRLTEQTEQLGRIGEYAGHVKNSLATAGELTTGNVETIARAAVGVALGFVPVVGDLYTVADSIASGNVHDGICAVVSLTATAIGLVFPPAAAVIGAALAVYQLGRLLWGFFQAEATPRDWVQDPPATPGELLQSGADIKYEARPFAGKSADVVFARNTNLTTQTLLLDSRWGEHNSDNRPVVTYTLPKTEVYRSLLPFRESSVYLATLNVWQNGNIYTATCRRTQTHGHATFICSDLDGSPTIGKGRPAVVTVTYLHDQNIVNGPDGKAICGPPPCVFPGFDVFSSTLTVLAEGKRSVKLNLPFSVGIG